MHGPDVEVAVVVEEDEDPEQYQVKGEEHQQDVLEVVSYIGLNESDLFVPRSGVMPQYALVDVAVLVVQLHHVLQLPIDSTQHFMHVIARHHVHEAHPRLVVRHRLFEDVFVQNHRIKQ